VLQGFTKGHLEKGGLFDWGINRYFMRTILKYSEDLKEKSLVLFNN